MLVLTKIILETKLPTKPQWTKAEEEILIQYYSKIGGTALHKLYLPGRSIGAIFMRAKSLGLKFERVYAEKYVPKVPLPKSGIYRITFETGHFYIGKSTNLTARLASHRRNWTRTKYGSFTSEVLHYCVKEDLAYLESKYITEAINDLMCLNKVIPKGF